MVFDPILGIYVEEAVEVVASGGIWEWFAMNYFWITGLIWGTGSLGLVGHFFRKNRHLTLTGMTIAASWPLLAAGAVAVGLCAWLKEDVWGAIKSKLLPAASDSKLLGK